MEGVVVSQWPLFAPEPASSSQIILSNLLLRIRLGNLLLRIRLVFEIFAEKLKSTSAAFHNQQACNGVKSSSSPNPVLVLNLKIQNTVVSHGNSLLATIFS
jgi:hypothetical protein